MTVEDHEVEVAHRANGQIAIKPRNMIVRCKFSLRDRIFQFTKNLKDLKNENGDYYYVSKQLPEPLLTAKRELDQKMKEVKVANSQLSDEQKHKQVKVQIKGNMLYLDDIPQWKHVHPPTVRDIFSPDQRTKDRMTNVTFVHSTAVEDKRSVFRGHAIQIKTNADIKASYSKLCLLYPESDHIMLAYRLKMHTGQNDDGEHGASKRLMKILDERKLGNIAVFVTREYGGSHLGPRRFVHIKKVARDALTELQLS